MQKQTINTIAKRFLLGNLVAVMFILSADATTVSKNETDPSSKNVEVKYVGTTADNLFFNVKFNNETGKSFRVFVLDENGEPLFQEKYSDKLFDKRFMLKIDQDLSKLTFMIQTNNGSFKEIFDVKFSTKITAEVRSNNK